MGEGSLKLDLDSDTGLDGARLKGRLPLTDCEEATERAPTLHGSVLRGGAVAGVVGVEPQNLCAP